MIEPQEKEDLFNSIETLPIEVQQVIERFEEMDETYKNCRELIKELNQVGYTCSFGLDGIPIELQKL